MPLAPVSIIETAQVLFEFPCGSLRLSSCWQIVQRFGHLKHAKIQSGENMCSKCDVCIDYGCSKTVANMEGKKNPDGSSFLSHIRSSSELSAVTSAAKSSAPTFVYKRRKLQKSHATAFQPNVSANTLSRNNLVYRRRKLQRDPVSIFPTQVSQNISPNAKSTCACLSIVRSEYPLPQAMQKYAVCEVLNETVDGCSAVEHGSDVKNKMNRAAELCSGNDSCSSSLLDMDHGSASLKTELDDTGECSSSGALRQAIGEDLSEKELLISILKRNGLLSRFRPNQRCASSEDAPSCSGSGSSHPCNVCGHLETAENLLICDHCEEAFHVSCCNPIIRKIPDDEWYCQSCFKKKHIIMETTKKSPIIRSEASSRIAASKGESGPIALMLKDPDPYTTGVRIGKSFQADVPDWCGPMTEDSDALGEPLELDPLDSFHLPVLSSNKASRSNSIGNWLQCQEVVVGVGESRDGFICGKWRRAPLFVDQTDNWDCFQSFLWDPTHADCAVPQELETVQVLKQLKYIEMLKPRLTAKRWRLDTAAVNGS
ncbi:hypothetical protein Nepgr_019783 [Nepenthes gracilis]|uniref:Uncharacterized protein n=1 Tax=Nepenthes gracilis TaxID=150966 RepID=A0AAD3SWP2_NEPGR|nr:hypothetical protein Nepgr_019783 [Nepenthes gracilis]